MQPRVSPVEMHVKGEFEPFMPSLSILTSSISFCLVETLAESAS